jgi:hypothetical protein
MSTPSTRSSSDNEEEESTPRITKFASCIREHASTAPYKKVMMFNADEQRADPAILSLMSSKFQTLLETIRKLDEEDKKTHGTLFKHFIFTDIRRSLFGAKAVASFLQVHGFDVLLRAEKGFRRRKHVAPDKSVTYTMVPTKKLKITLATHEPVEGGSNRVGVLQSAPVWKSQVGVDVRKRMLSIFNSRPDNIHGEMIRIMVLDSKFKEGIDLFDVKYVHLLEPQITEADMKQAVGRATRFCGQRGLSFVPNIGWRLQVFLYETKFGNLYPFRKSGSATIFDAHTYMMQHSGLDLGLLEMSRNLTVLAIRSAVDYDLTYKINNFKQQSQIFDITDLKESVTIVVGGAASPKVVPTDTLNMAKCMPRSNKFFPYTIAAIRKAMTARGYEVPKRVSREWICENLKDKRDVIQDLLESRAVVAAAAVAAVAAPVAIAVAHTNRFPQPPTLPSPSATAQDMPDLGDFFAAAELAAELGRVTSMGFQEFQEYIRTRYAEYGWESPVVRSGCETAPKPGAPVVFSKTQDFVRHYLTPQSPMRGLLAWHSVGTGKTCTAVAAATTEFERQGYSILWVTRNSLMADVWKNVFGAVCSIPVQEKISAGKPLPGRLPAQKRWLGDEWFDPISYRTLQNAIVPAKKGRFKGQVNKVGRRLQDRNGKQDPLRRTFLVIDEVHKLLDGDLKPSEMADFDAIAAAVQNSYAKSGDDSVRILLMTATPITDNPAGLFRLLNLLLPVSKQLPPFAAFRAKYSDEGGTISEEGKAFFQDRTKGLISYLNREFDPTTFAQPDFQRIPVPASGALLPTDEEIAQSCLEAEGMEEDDPCNVEDLKAELEDSLAELEEYDFPKRELIERRKTLKLRFRQRIRDCKATLQTRKELRKIRKGSVDECLIEKAGTRKLAYRHSQQKSVAKCFERVQYGAPPKFGSVTDLRRMAFARKKTPKSVSSTRVTVGHPTPEAPRSITPDARTRYAPIRRLVRRPLPSNSNSDTE